MNLKDNLFKYEKRDKDYKMKKIFIIGAQKCMTTYCHNIIVGSEYVSESKRKEMHFFDGYPNYKYSGNFVEQFKINNKTKYIIDSTPSYSIIPGVINAIEELDKDSYIIFCTRDKLRRTISQINHEIRNGFIKYDNNYIDILKKDEEIERNNYWSNVIGNYKLKNDYQKVIEEWSAKFDNFIHLNFDNNINDELKRLELFLNIEIKIKENVEKNESVLPKSKILSRVGFFFERHGYHRIFSLLKYLNKSDRKFTKLSYKDKKELENYL